LFNLPDLDSPPLSEPIFQIHRRKPLAILPAKQPTRVTKHYCAFITKRILREILNPLYARELAACLAGQGLTSPEALRPLLKGLETVTGPVRFLQLLREHDPAPGQAFLAFGRWYLQNRYIRHLLQEGRIEEREKYVQFKNREMKKLFRPART
jgi:hypothetical protein